MNQVFVTMFFIILNIFIIHAQLCWAEITKSYLKNVSKSSPKPWISVKNFEYAPPGLFVYVFIYSMQDIFQIYLLFHGKIYFKYTYCFIIMARYISYIPIVRQMNGYYISVTDINMYMSAFLSELWLISQWNERANSHREYRHHTANAL